MTLGSLSEAERTYIEKDLLKPSLMAFRLGAMLAAEGVFEPTDKEWMGEWAGFEWLSQNLGRFSIEDYEGAADLSPKYTSKTGSGIALAGRLVLGPAEISAAQSNMYGIKKGLEEIVQMQLFDFRKQIEGIMSSGDASQFQAVGDPLAKSTGSAVFTGMLNGTNGTSLTTISGGVGDNVATNGYFMKTCNTIEKALLQAGIDSTIVHLFSDTDTWQVLRDSKHATSGEYEYQQIKDSFPKWTWDVEDYLLEKGAETTHRIWAVSPRDAQGQKKASYKISKQLHIIPAYNGGVDKNGKYTWLLGWKGGPMIRDAKTVLRTGSLTIA
jgi:hypothetical protein